MYYFHWCLKLKFPVETAILLGFIIRPFVIFKDSFEEDRLFFNVRYLYNRTLYGNMSPLFTFLLEVWKEFFTKIWKCIHTKWYWYRNSVKETRKIAEKCVWKFNNMFSELLLYFSATWPIFSRVVVFRNNPRVLHEHPLYGPHVTVWCAIYWIMKRCHLSRNCCHST